MLSEEGGRFYQALSRYMIVETDAEETEEHPEFRWIAVHQLMELLRHSHYLNVQARSLVTCLHGLLSAPEPVVPNTAGVEEARAAGPTFSDMISTKTDSELGPELMTLRGMQWIYGIKGDPYALLLRAESDDPHELGQRARDHGALMWSTAESWVTARYSTAAAVLNDPRFGAGYPKPANGAAEAAAWQVPAMHDILPLDDVYLAADREVYRRLREVTVEAVGTDFTARIAERREAEPDRLGTTFDLMTHFAHPLAAGALAGVLGMADASRLTALCAATAPALDATVCPPRLATARS